MFARVLHVLERGMLAGLDGGFLASHGGVSAMLELFSRVLRRTRKGILAALNERLILASLVGSFLLAPLEKTVSCRCAREGVLAPLGLTSA